jgi:hypothetical protein
MPEPNDNDISIGDGRWITFIDVTDGQIAAVNVDAILEPVWPFLRLLETHCVAGCCGIEAFDFWSDNIARATNVYSGVNLRERLVAVRDRVGETNATVFVSDRFNSYFDKRVLLALLDHIVSHV